MTAALIVTVAPIIAMAAPTIVMAAPIIAMAASIIVMAASIIVMAGLEPAIPSRTVRRNLVPCAPAREMPSPCGDGRLKAGHDDDGCGHDGYRHGVHACGALRMPPLPAP
jgi:hypothetical protein